MSPAGRVTDSHRSQQYGKNSRKFLKGDSERVFLHHPLSYVSRAMGVLGYFNKGIIDLLPITVSIISLFVIILWIPTSQTHPRLGTTPSGHEGSLKHMSNNLGRSDNLSITIERYPLSIAWVVYLYKSHASMDIRTMENSY